MAAGFGSIGALLQINARLEKHARSYDTLQIVTRTRNGGHPKRMHPGLSEHHGMSGARALFDRER
jgi:hypothetical protein